jgi:hypothetical protein
VWGNPLPGWLGADITNIIAGIVMFVLPILSIWKMQLSSRSKIGLTILFGLGFLYVRSRVAFSTILSP